MGKGKSDWATNFAGLSGQPYKLFGIAPAWVDTEKAPGTTVQTLASSVWDVVKTFTVTFTYQIWSPNLVWFAISLWMYVSFPYDFDAARVSFAPSAPWILARLKLNLGVVLVYIGFFYVSLYHLGRSARKFKPSNTPTAARMCHNVWYTVLGAVQWTAWECVFVRLWATGKLPYVADADVFATWPGVARAALWALLVPVLRELHFYWAHRFLHFRVLYKYVHSLHHRNVDPEPFSGLCMHPVEHLYYYATVWPSLAFLMSPFHLLWNGMHAVISPAAGHSGWEDHWQSDQFHYLHHAKFECNYGGGGLPFDKVFGTFRECLGTSKLYTGAGAAAPANHGVNGGGKAAANKPAKKATGLGSLTLRGAFAKPQDALYFACVAGIAWVFCSAAFEPRGAWWQGAHFVAALVAWGPIGAGLLLRALFGDSLPLTWPFHKEPLFGLLGLHLLAGLLFATVPVYLVVSTLLS